MRIGSGWLLAGALVGGFAAALVPLATRAVAEEREGRRAPADNSLCSVCHANWDDEKFVQRHRRKGVGCVDCHGESEAHMDDEESHVPPEIVIPREMVDRTCMENCHRKEKVERVGKHRKWLDDPDNRKVCTDCHGEHRLDKRQRRWDRAGRLIEADGRPVEP
jgi:hypothetical protein